MNLYRKMVLGVIVGLLVTIFVLPNNSRHTADLAKAKASVMITRLDGRSGGTGVVLTSSANESKILTNSHVCGVVEHGGIVSNNYHRGFVTTFTRSAIHDLCLITVATDFKTSTDIAYFSAPITSTAAVSGYPHLQPNIITRGSFGERVIVTIMTGIRPCSPEDLANPDPTMQTICMFLGGLPILRTYEAQFTGATIQAGNSGSAVYNEKGQLSGLVFAGSGDLSYGLIVPLEYINNFINNELAPGGTLTVNKPDTIFILDASALSGSSKFYNACRSLDHGDKSYEFLGKFCRMVSQDLIYNKD